MTRSAGSSTASRRNFRNDHFLELANRAARSNDGNTDHPTCCDQPTNRVQIVHHRHQVSGAVNRRRHRPRVRPRRRAAPGTPPPGTAPAARSAASTSIANSPRPRAVTRQRRSGIILPTGRSRSRPLPPAVRPAGTFPASGSASGRMAALRPVPQCLARASTSAPQSGHTAGSDSRTSMANCVWQPRHSPATVSPPFRRRPPADAPPSRRRTFNAPPPSGARRCPSPPPPTRAIRGRRWRPTSSDPSRSAR